MDANALHRLFERGDTPANAVVYRKDERVMVWTLLRSGVQGFAHATVLEFETSLPGSFLVEPDEQYELPSLSYSNADPTRGSFCLALPLASCGNLDNERRWICVYFMDLGESASCRAGWAACLVGPGAQALGALLAHHLQILPDADDGSLYGRASNGEHYWLYLNAPSVAEAQARIHSGAGRIFWNFWEARRLIEEEQVIHCQHLENSWELRGPCSTELVAPLRARLPSAQVRVTSSTSRHSVSREAIEIKEAPDAEGTLETLAAALEDIGLPASILRIATPAGSMAAPLAGWRTRHEGPEARAPGKQERGGWSSPANTFCVEGPAAEIACLVAYARLQGQAPVLACAQLKLPDSWGHLDFSHPFQVAARTWALCGLGSEQSGGNYFGPWLLRAPQTPLEEEEQSEVMFPWNARTLLTLFEGRLVSVPASQRYHATVSLAECPPFIEWCDIRTPEGAEIFSNVGPVGLENPGAAPKGWVRSAQPQMHFRFTMLQKRGAAFPAAGLREAVAVCVDLEQIREIDHNPALRRQVQLEFQTNARHIGLEDFRGDPVTVSGQARPVCASGHQTPWVSIPSATFRAADVEDWAHAIGRGLPCRQCGGCEEAFNKHMPGAWRLEQRRNSEGEALLVGTFYSPWQPGRCTSGPVARAHQRCLLDAPVAPALPSTSSRESQAATEFVEFGESAFSELSSAWGMPPEHKMPAREILQRLPQRWSSADRQECKALEKLISLALGPGAGAQSQGFRVCSELQAAVEFLEGENDVQRLTQLFAGLARSKMPIKSNLVRELLILGQQTSTVWTREQLFTLAALPHSQNDERGLLGLLTAAGSGGVGQRAREQDGRKVARAWLTQHDMKQTWFSESVFEQLRSTFRSARGCSAFVAVLRYSTRTHRADSLSVAAGVVMTAVDGNAHQMEIEKDSSAWNASALIRWLQITSPWTPQERVCLLRSAVQSLQPAQTVLDALATNDRRIEDPKEALKESTTAALLRVEAKTSARTTRWPGASLAERTRRQLCPPVPHSNERWLDSHPQPEQQALLVAHTLRDFLSQILDVFASTGASREGPVIETESKVQDMLRGEPEFLIAEKHQEPRLLTETVMEQLSERASAKALPESATHWRTLLLEVLSRGVASTSLYTGRCLKRDCLWVQPAK